MTVDAVEALSIRRLMPEEVRARAHELADVLIDAVEGGAAVSFLAPMTPLAAVRWAFDVADRMGRRAHLFTAEIDGRIVGFVKLVRAGAANQPHRAEVAKLVVHRAHRGRGVGAALMHELEVTARVLGITLLTLDTAETGAACRLYDRLGYRRAGTIPGYALAPDGTPVATVIYYKVL
ncbi:GNAT family N-acetyltransferase [Mongoliimonas terrestris]|uniref:GNAT family N-acetyltransferase n=1 Tax=Mongoliimonas terrestris TaxID=1709001 RepID=UPI00094964F9|nr:GNAT family N-acetyltransferase [Mongoliimonas terrestris]